MWQDLDVYTNNKKEKVISQWRRTSGSISDYRDRKIIGEFDQVRISFNYDKKKLKGLWYKHNIEKNTITKIDYNKSD
jgi:ribosomal protein L32E